MRRLAFWQSDVVSDYLAFRGNKLLLQDCKDEIIAHPASLKVGVASRVLLNTTLLKIAYESPAYNYARFLHSLPLPHNEEFSSWLAEDAMSIRVIEHFFAAYTYLAVHYHEHQAHRRRNLGADSVDSRGDGDGDSDASEGSHTNLLNKFDRHTRSPPSPSKHIASLAHARLDLSERLYSMDIHALKMPALCKAYVLVGRVQGSAQILNHAFVGGLDHAIAWVVSYVLWLRDMEVTRVQGGISHAIQSLRQLVEVSPSTQEREGNAGEAAGELKELVNVSISFLECIQKLQIKLQRKTNSSDIESSGSEASIIGGETSKSAHSSSQRRSGSPTRANYNSISSCAEAACVTYRGKTHDVGQLISLQCGHNGWPSKEEMEAISQWVSQNEALHNVK
eukprot:gene28851-34821_t